MSGTEIATPGAASVAFERHANSLAVEAANVNNSVGEWIKSKLTAIMEADSFEAINALMTSTGLTAARDLIGRTFEIRDFVVRDTAFAESEGSWGAYCIVQAVDTASGEEFVIDGGGDNFIAGIVSMRNLYGFPFTGTLLSTGTQSGHDLQYWRFQNPGRKPVKK